MSDVEHEPHRGVGVSTVRDRCVNAMGDDQHSDDHGQFEHHGLTARGGAVLLKKSARLEPRTGRSMFRIFPTSRARSECCNHASSELKTA
jgi:hypothetical protein